MPKDKYIVGIGAANVDVYGKSSIKIKEHFDHPSIIKTSTGGVTRNILENCSKLGIKTKLLSVVGDDVYGKKVLEDSIKAKIDVKNVNVIKGERTGVFMQVQDKNNDMHLALCDMSISKHIDLKYISSKDKIIKKASLIVLDPSLDLEVIEYILDAYNNIPIFVDPISDLYAKKIKPYLNRIYCIKPNKNELVNLSDIKINNDDDVIKAFNKINAYTDRVFVSLSKGGCLYQNEKGEVKMKSLKPLKQMVNASGAGDAFMAGIIYGYLNDLNIEKTVDYANACGMIAVKSEETINPELSVKLIRKTLKENKL